MAENDTNTNDTNDVSGTNDKSNVAGDGNTDTNKVNQEEKTLTQKEVNAILKRAKLDAEKDAKVKFEKNLEGKTVLSDEDLKTLKSEWEKEYSVRVALNNKRAEYKAKGLTDAQLDAIQVEKAEDYDKRVTDLFGVILKKEAPVLNGGKSNESDDADPNRALNTRLRQGLVRRKI